MRHRDSFVTPKLWEIHYCVNGISSQATHTVCHLNLSNGNSLSLFIVIIEVFSWPGWLLLQKYMETIKNIVIDTDLQERTDAGVQISKRDWFTHFCMTILLLHIHSIILASSLSSLHNKAEKQSLTHKKLKYPGVALSWQLCDWTRRDSSKWCHHLSSSVIKWFKMVCFPFR